MNIEKVKAFFFEAMRHGWAAGFSPVSGFAYPFSSAQTFHYSKGGFFMIDYYFSSPESNNSYGTKIIWDDGTPVWMMHYGGWYEKKAIPFLKCALVRNYHDGIFMGGRGPEMLEGEDHTLQYINNVQKNDFASFYGSEEIIVTSGQLGMPLGKKLGEHRYLGGII